YPEAQTEASPGDRHQAGRRLPVRLIPAQPSRGDAITRRQQVRLGAQRIEDRLGMLGPQVREHRFHRAVVTEVALAEQPKQSYPWRNSRPAGAPSSLARQGHDLPSCPLTTGRTESAWLW